MNTDKRQTLYGYFWHEYGISLLERDYSEIERILCTSKPIELPQTKEEWNTLILNIHGLFPHSCWNDLMIECVKVGALMRIYPNLVIERPQIITICGSMRFIKEMRKEAELLTLNGHMVLMPFINTKYRRFSKKFNHIKPVLDKLHLKKIDICDGIYVVNPGGYIGESTRKEIEYARESGKIIEFMVKEEPKWTY